MGVRTLPSRPSAFSPSKTSAQRSKPRSTRTISSSRRGLAWQKCTPPRPATGRDSESGSARQPVEMAVAQLRGGPGADRSGIRRRLPRRTSTSSRSALPRIQAARSPRASSRSSTAQGCGPAAASPRMTDALGGRSPRARPAPPRAPAARRGYRQGQRSGPAWPHSGIEDRPAPSGPRHRFRQHSAPPRRTVLIGFATTTPMTEAMIHVAIGRRLHRRTLTEFRSQIDPAILGKIKPLFHNLNF